MARVGIGAITLLSQVAHHYERSDQITAQAALFSELRCS